MWNTISKEKRIWTGIIKNKTKHNEKYILQTSIMPIVDTNNNVTEYIALRNNITNINRETE